MKATPSGLLAHFQGSTLTVSNLFKVQWTNGTIICLTDHDQDIPAIGLTFQSAVGFNASDVASSDTLAVDNLEIHSVLTNDVIRQADIDAGLWDNAYVTQYKVNWADPSMGVDYVQTGRLGNVQTGLQSVVNEIRALSQAMARNIVRLIGPDCQHDFCDTGGIKFGAGCSLNPAAWTTTGTVESISSDGLTIFDSARTEGTPYFVGGMVTFTSGLTMAQDGDAHQRGGLIHTSACRCRLPFPWRHLFHPCRVRQNQAHLHRTRQHGQPWRIR